MRKLAAVSRPTVVWTKFSFAMLCCWPLFSWAADPWCSSRALQLEWLPNNQAEPSVGSVQIKNPSGKIVQVLGSLENYGENSESLRTSRDFNNDGCADLVVTSSVAAIGNESIKAFLYNPRTRRFDVSQALSGIGGLDIDPRDKNCVTGSWKGGAMDFYSARHCWRKGKLVMKSEHSVSPLYNDQGELQCYQNVITDYRGGKKRKRTSCTKEF